MKQQQQNSDDETIQSLKMQPKSQRGLVGLVNLGNTCLINSFTQCLSNTYPLAEYFLNNQYFRDINMSNNQGTQGQLIRKLGSLIKQMWYGEKQLLTPISYKQAIDRFIKFFEGCTVVDFIEQMLGFIHEDLNKVKIKPTNQMKDSDYQSHRFVVAQKSWQYHLTKNQSIIAELMQGQIQSQIDCPNCLNTQLSFHTFNVINLPICKFKKTFLNFRLYKNQFQYVDMTFPFDTINDITLIEYSNLVAQKLKLENCGFLVYRVNTFIKPDLLSEQMLIREVRKSSKCATLCFRQLSDNEVQIVNKHPIEFVHQYLASGFKKPFGQPGFFLFDGTQTLKEIHYEIFNQLSILFQDHPGLDYKTQVLNQYYQLLFKSNMNYWNPCSFCNAKNCQDCEIKFEDDTIEQLQKNVLNLDSQCRIQIIILWKQSPYKWTQVPQIFDQYLVRNKQESEKNEQQMLQQFQNYVPQAPTLQDCLRKYQRTEKVRQDCQNCMQNVEAIQTNQIYKAPKILIFSLQRTKKSNRLYSQKNQDLIAFPVNGLDLTDQIINTNTPQQYEFETQNDNGEYKKNTAIYDLYAVTNHIGPQDKGHYTAYVKNKLNQKWFNCDDQQIQEIPVNKVVTNSAQILFYQRRSNTDL